MFIYSMTRKLAQIKIVPVCWVQNLHGSKLNWNETRLDYQLLFWENEPVLTYKTSPLKNLHAWIIPDWTKTCIDQACTIQTTSLQNLLGLKLYRYKTCMDLSCTGTKLAQIKTVPVQLECIQTLLNSYSLDLLQSLFESVPNQCSAQNTLTLK